VSFRLPRPLLEHIEKFCQVKYEKLLKVFFNDFFRFVFFHIPSIRLFAVNPAPIAGYEVLRAVIIGHADDSIKGQYFSCIK
ncbi:MAG: hypothetical protein QME51_04200, partial [Planctomycetota bacterium]|nr:hypothetical protein [Planctomycetota bacterium]